MPEMKFVFDKSKCIHCGLCIKDCSINVLDFGEDKCPKVIKNGESLCFKCQHCFSICPVGAISIFGNNPENSPLAEKKDLLNLIQTRRSCRHYKQENAEGIDKLKEMLKYIPTGCNYRGLHFSIIDNIDVMNKFRDKVNSAIIKYQNLKPVNAKFGRIVDDLLKGKDVIFRGAPHLIAVSVDKKSPCAPIDPVIALSYFELYANSLGLGTCWCGYAYIVLSLLPELQGQLEIPDTHKLAYVMLFGKPETQYSRCPQPEDYPITIVKDGENRKLTLKEKLTRIFENIK